MDEDDAIVKKKYVSYHDPITVFEFEELHSLKPEEHKPLVRELGWKVAQLSSQ